MKKLSFLIVGVIFFLEFFIGSAARANSIMDFLIFEEKFGIVIQSHPSTVFNDDGSPIASSTFPIRFITKDRLSRNFKALSTVALFDEIGKGTREVANIYFDRSDRLSSISQERLLSFPLLPAVVDQAQWTQVSEILRDLELGASITFELTEDNKISTKVFSSTFYDQSPQAIHRLIDHDNVGEAILDFLNSYL